MNDFEAKAYILKLRSELFRYVNDLEFNNTEINNIYNTVKNPVELDLIYLGYAYDKASLIVESVNPNQCMAVIRNWYLDGINSIDKLNENVTITNQKSNRSEYIHYKVKEKERVVRKIFYNLENYIESKENKYLNNIYNLSFKHKIYVKKILNKLDIEINNIEAYNDLKMTDITKLKNEEINKIYKLKEKTGMSEYNTKEFLGIIASDINEKEVDIKGENKKVKGFLVKFKDLESGKYKTLYVNAFEKFVDKLNEFKKNDTISIKGNLKERETENKVYLNLDMLEIEHKELDKSLYPQYIEFYGNLAEDPILESTTKNGKEYFYINTTIFENDRQTNTGIPHYCNAIGERADVLSKLKKGDFVNIKGEIRTYKDKHGKNNQQILIKNVRKIEKQRKSEKEEEKKTKELDKERSR